MNITIDVQVKKNNQVLNQKDEHLNQILAKSLKIALKKLDSNLVDLILSYKNFDSIFESLSEDEKFHPFIEALNGYYAIEDDEELDEEDYHEDNTLLLQTLTTLIKNGIDVNKKYEFLNRTREKTNRSGYGYFLEMLEHINNGYFDLFEFFVKNGAQRLLTYKKHSPIYYFLQDCSENLDYYSVETAKRFLKLIKICVVYGFKIKPLYSKTVSDIAKNAKFYQIKILAEEIPLLFLLYCLEKKTNIQMLFSINDFKTNSKITAAAR